MKAAKLHNGAIQPYGLDNSQSELTIIVSLSERNLLALLSKLKRPDSAKALCKTTEAGFIMLVVEPDDEHYGTTTPGKMHPKDEAFIAKAGEFK